MIAIAMVVSGVAVVVVVVGGGGIGIVGIASIIVVGKVRQT